MQLRLSDLIANLLNPVVELDPEPGCGQLIAHPSGVLQMAVGNGQTTAWTGASHSGQAPAKCSISSAMKRSKLPKMAR